MERELPTGFVDFAVSTGFLAANHWSKASIESFQRSWEEILIQKNNGQAVMLPIFSLLYRMNIEDDAFLAHKNFEGASRLRSVHDQSIRILELYPQISEGTNTPKEPARRPVQIGLGLTSSYKHKNINRLSVKLDEHTVAKPKAYRHILYAVGWSVRGDFDEEY
jgi:hypothetical protein